ncbi:MAG: DUF805 domain-containing protein, partial [Proteobacteria bacterium]|nr:DUF805 domain-containing protein [Pseudomonadota bacterium]
IVLLAAAVARRLHDSGRSGWWGAPTPILLIAGLVGMMHVFAVMSAAPASNALDGPPIDFASFGVMMLCNLAYLASLVLLVILCSLPSQAGDNRYGAPANGGETS